MMLLILLGINYIYNKLNMEKNKELVMCLDGGVCQYGLCISQKDLTERGESFHKWKKEVERAEKEIEIHKVLRERKRAAQYREHTKFTKWLASAPREFLEQFYNKYVFDDVNWEEIELDMKEGELMQGEYKTDDLMRKLEELYIQ